MEMPFNFNFIRQGGAQLNPGDIRYRIKDRRLDRSAALDDLSVEDKTLIQQVLQTEIPLNREKAHNMKVVVADQGFHITLNNKLKFFVSKPAAGPSAVAEPAAQPVSSSTSVVIQEPYHRSAVTSSFKNFWRMVTNFFHRPAFESKEFVNRNPKEAVIADYRSLRKGLGLGQKWLMRSSERPQVAAHVENAIHNSKRVKKALGSRSPKRAMDNLARQLAREVFALSSAPEGAQVIIPSGYLTGEGVLQPVMVRFYREDNETKMEVYCDHTDAGAKIAPTQRFQLSSFGPHQQLIPKLLAPLLVEKAQAHSLRKAAETSDTFTRMVQEAETRVKQGSLPTTEAASESDAAKSKTPAAAGLISYEALIRSIEALDLTKVEGPEELMTASKSPMARVASWFDHLIPPEQKLTRNEKLNLLYHITLDWADDKLRQITDIAPLSQQLEAYSVVQQQLDHTIGKIAKAINGGYNVETEAIPADLKKLQQRCERKVGELRAKQQSQRSAGLSETLETSHPATIKSAVLSPLSSPNMTTQEPQPVGIAIPAAELTQIRDDWQAVKATLSLMTSPEESKRFQVQQALANAQTYLTPPSGQHSISEVMADSSLASTYIHEQLQTLVETDRAALESLCNSIRGVRTDDKVESLRNTLEQVIQCPHFIPRENSAQYYVAFLKKIADPQSSYSSDLMPTILKLRALLKLRHLIPPETMIESERLFWDSCLLTPSSDASPAFKASQEEAARSSEPLDRIRLPSPISQIVQEPLLSPEPLANTIADLYYVCHRLRDAAIAEPNLQKKKALLQEAHEYALDALSILPPPGTEGAYGEANIWTALSPEQSRQIISDMSTLENVLWETQMRLGQSVGSARARFYIVKAQAIRQTAIRTLVADKQQQVVENLRQRLQDAPDTLKRTGYLTLAPSLSIDWSHIRSLDDIRQLEGMLDPQIEDLSLLLLDRYTLDTQEINVLLTQDLTGLLSRDVAMQRDLTAIYHFVVRDYNQGQIDGISTMDAGYRTSLTPQSPIPDISSDGNKEFAGSLLSQMKTSSLMYRMCSDADYVLASRSPTVGVGFFAAQPDTLLRAGNLTIREATDESGKSAEIVTVGDQPSVLANVYPEGHPQTRHIAGNGEVEGPEGGLLPNRPFLPTLFRSESSVQKDHRTLKTFDVLQQYAVEKAQASPQAISPQALQKLFIIRDGRCASNLSVVSGYSSDTAINALAFLVDPVNMSYLENADVQKFLVESLFGPFVLQQALIDFPTSVKAHLDLIGERIEEAIANGKQETALFLTEVLQQCREHVTFAIQSLTDSGVFSGHINGSLPSHLATTGGALSSLIRQQSVLERNTPDLNESVASQLDGPFILHPIIGLIQQMQECLDSVRSIEQRMQMHGLPQSYYCTPKEDGQRPIDTVTNPTAQRRQYTHLCKDYKNRPSAPFTEQDYVDIFTAGRILQQERTEDSSDLTSWLHAKVLPSFASLPEATKQSICTRLANKWQTGLNLPPDSRWRLQESQPHILQLSTAGRSLTLDLFSFTLSGTGITSSEELEQPIPDSILTRRDVQNALQTRGIKATVNRNGPKTTYSWQHQGQDFQIESEGSSVSIRRTINGTPYQFRSIEVSTPDSPAENLLATNGVWSNPQGTYSLFTSGMEMPKDSDTFTARVEDNKVTRLTSSDGQPVSVLPFEDGSALDFVKGDHLIISLDPANKKPAHIAIKGTSLTFTREGRQWQLREGSHLIGTLSEPADLKQMIAHFGDNWSQYIIPLRKADGTESYILLPYEQKVNDSGGLDTIQETMPIPQILTLQSDGTIKGSIASDLYLAHKLLQEARQTRNPETARQLYLQVNRHLQQLENQHLPRDPQQQRAITDAIHLLTTSPAVALTPMPSASALALQLRIALTARRLRGDDKALALTPKEDFQEMEGISKMQEAYQKMTADGEAQKFKDIFNLSERDRRELGQINQRLLQALTNSDTVAAYFGATGRLTTPQEMPRLTSVDPAFLLALVRVAKRPDPSQPIDLRQITTPQPLNNFLENFWGYMSSIRDHNLTPEQLLVFLQPSILPIGSNASEERSLKNLDLQARQALLAYAELQKLFGLGLNPTIWLREKLTTFQESTRDQQQMVELLRSLPNAALARQAQEIHDSFSRLELQGENKSVGNRSVEMPKLDTFILNIGTAQGMVGALSNELKKTLDDSNEQQRTLLREISTKYNEIDEAKQAIQKARQELGEQIQGRTEKQKEILTEDYNQRISTLEATREQRRNELKEMEAKRVTDPVTQTAFSALEIVQGQHKQHPIYQIYVNSSSFYSTLDTKMRETKSNMKDIDKLLKGWQQIENMVQSAISTTHEPMPKLVFPSGAGAQRLIDEAMRGELAMETRADVMRLGARALREAGPKQTLQMLDVARNREQLTERVGRLAPPLYALAILGSSTSQSFGPLRIVPGYQQPAAGAALDALTGSVMGTEAVVSLPKAIIPVALGDIRTNALAQRYYNTAQLENLHTQLNALPEKERSTLLGSLSRALMLNERSTAAQLAINENIETINRVTTRANIAIEPAANEVEGEFANDVEAYQDMRQHFSPLAMSLQHLPIPPSVDLANLTLALNSDSPQNVEIAVTALKTALPGPRYLSLHKALELFAWARSHHEQLLPEQRETLFLLFQTRNILRNPLVAIEEAYNTLAEPVHQARHTELVGQLRNSLPDAEDSSYHQELSRGFERLEQTNPLPYAQAVKPAELDALTGKVKRLTNTRQATLDQHNTAILREITRKPLKDLPKEMQQIRLRRGSDQELLDTAYRLHSRGVFATGAFQNAALHHSIYSAQVTATQLKLLEGGRFNASKSLDTLKALDQKRQDLIRDYDSANPTRQILILREVEALDITYAKESSRLIDCLDRGQGTDHLNELPEALKPHLRKIVYLQNRLGMVLRPDQIDALNKMIENPALLLQLRMGLGKTSVLLPFALEILGSKGITAIGMVPKALFTTNFDEMDETTRLVFDLAGNQFLFNRNDAPLPLTTITLANISQKSANLCRAIENNQYILTTIESKASLDDKIAEVELSQKALQRQIDLTTDPEQKSSLLDNLARHQSSLDILYRTKGIFEHDNTRIIIDEADQVGRANYSVNAEIGAKAPPSMALIEVVSEVFSLIRRDPTLVQMIQSNSQFDRNEDQITSTLESLALNWLLERGYPLPDSINRLRLSSWLAGGPPLTPTEVEQLGPLASELKVLRRTLNSGLRGALALKIGLNTDYDPVHQAIGVPASQGVTTATTRFSDPLMQLCLSQMIAINRTQGEAFLKSTANDVYDRIGKKIGEMPEGGERALYQDAHLRLEEALDIQRRTGVADFQALLSPQWASSLLLRQEFANQAAINRLIYVTDGQIKRSAQDALRGCNTICLTGTADRKLAPLIEARNVDGMRDLEDTGRQSTAEVVYRMAKSLPQGLQTPVQTYSSDPIQALEQFRIFAADNSGYHFLVNQAGACDTMNQKQIVEALYQRAQRPIIYLSVETGLKSVWINGVEKSLDALTTQEKQQVQEKGFYYYHTPHARGTHFDIPTGSKGALVLSPKVNANDRDQAAYRARELGEGHIVEPFVTELQHRRLQTLKEINHDNTPVNLGDILKIHHNQTLADEAEENLAAYQLHLNGVLMRAAEKAKSQMYVGTEGPASTAMQQPGKTPIEEDTIRAKIGVTEILESFFLEKGGNDRYLQQLDSEFYQGGTLSVKDHLESIIEGQQRKAGALMLKLQSLRNRFDIDSPAYNMVSEALNRIEDVTADLTTASSKLDSVEWPGIQASLPDTVAASPASQGICEAEAEQEAQQEQQVQSESMSEQTAQSQATRAALSELDQDLMERLEPTFLAAEITRPVVMSLASDAPPVQAVQTLWQTNITVSQALEHELKYAAGTAMPDMTVIVMKHQIGDPAEPRYQNIIVLATAREGAAAASQWSIWQDTIVAGSRITYGQSSGCILKPTMNRDGTFRLVHQASSPMSTGLTKSSADGKIKKWDEDDDLKAEILFARLCLGPVQLKEEDWGLLRTYYRRMQEDDSLDLNMTLRNRLSDTNPRFLQHIMEQLRR